MNTNMFENRIVQDNINKLEEYGYNFVMPAVAGWRAAIPERANWRRLK